ncbi:hypothetical protein V6Z11_D02G170200 [Gossypium hirsutum]
MGVSGCLSLTTSTRPTPLLVNSSLHFDDHSVSRFLCHQRTTNFFSRPSPNFLILNPYRLFSVTSSVACFHYYSRTKNSNPTQVENSVIRWNYCLLLRYRNRENCGSKFDG